MKGPTAKASSEARARLSAIDIGRIRPSLLRSSGISAVAGRPRLAARGRGGEGRLAVDRDLAGDSPEHAEEGEQQFLLALPVEAAEAEDLAAAGREADAVQPVLPGEVLDSDERRRPRPHGLWRKLGLDVAADHQLMISSAVRAPFGKVSMWRPLRKTEQVSASASISCMRCEM